MLSDPLWGKRGSNQPSKGCSPKITQLVLLALSSPNTGLLPALLTAQGDPTQGHLLPGSFIWAEAHG